MADNVKDLRLLLAYECKFDVNLTDDEGRTALHWAVIKDSISCIEFLLQNGARQDIPDRFKNSKDYAAKSTNKDVLKLFNISEEDQVLVSLAFSGMKL
ncbi:MAG: ankyrin repeat domain-containing protein [Coxiellaceae bacterium]|nr:MAG: ankyrin repeat domain-containing protein [Coxiellaceae bacterium]